MFLLSPDRMDLPLRPLLLDCRIELRKLIRNFDKTELCARLDEAMSALVQDSVRAAQLQRATEKATAAAAPHAPSERTAQQVAYAWQMACRPLKNTQPKLYAELNAEVLKLLDAGGYTDASGEIARLRQDLHDAEQAEHTTKLAKMKLQAQLTALHKAIAAAVPEVADGADPQAAAIKRLAVMEGWKHAVPTPVHRNPFTSNGSAAAPARGLDDVPPSSQVLELVRDGSRVFSKAQRDFVVGEALIVTGWQFTPVELLEKGEPWLASLMLERSVPR